MINALGRASVRFQWSPGHSNIPGNNLTHTLTKQATKKGRSITSIYNQPVLRTIALYITKEIQPPKEECFNSSKSGKFTKIINKALPRKHTQLLYNKKPHNRALILY